MELGIFTDKEINVFLDMLIAEQLEKFSGSTILDKGVRYIDNQKAVYFKMRAVYKVQNMQVEGISENYFTIHKGKLFQIGGFYPTIPVNESNKEVVINLSLASFVFEDWNDESKIVNSKLNNETPNPIKRALQDSFGNDLSNFGLLLSFIISILFTWGLGLLLPVLLRFVFIKKPMSKESAFIFVFIIWLVELVVINAFDAESKHHNALLLVAIVSYRIMSSGFQKNETLKFCKYCGNKVVAPEDACSKCGNVFMNSVPQKDKKRWKELLLVILAIILIPLLILMVVLFFDK